jgi:phage shock protein A
MAENETKTNEEAEEPRDPEEIEREIEETREDLAETLGAVAEKADVKKQAKRKVDETKERAKAKVADAKEALPGGGADVAPGAEAGPQAGPPEPPAAQRYAEQARAYADENPEHVGLLGALLSGIVIGWLLGRRRA